MKGTPVALHYMETQPINNSCPEFSAHHSLCPVDLFLLVLADPVLLMNCDWTPIPRVQNLYITTHTSTQQAMITI